MAQHDPLANLDEIKWADLEHAYGSAENIPKLLRMLQSQNEMDRDGAYSSLSGSIYHQGSRYSASAAAVPFLCGLLERDDTCERPRVLRLVTHLAIGDPTHRWMQGVDIARWRETVKEVQLPAFARELEQERLEFVEQAADDEDRRKRQQKLVFLSTPVEIAKSQTDELTTYDAVKCHVGTFINLLKDPTAAMRIEAAYILSWFPEEATSIAVALMSLLKEEVDQISQATALIALGLLHNKRMVSDEDVVPLLQSTFAEPQSTPLVRWAAASALVLLHSFSPEHIDEVLRKLREPTYLKDVEDWDVQEHAIPFADPDLGSLAAMVLKDLDDGDAEKLLGALIVAIPNSRYESTVVLSQMALQAAFTQNTDPRSKESLSDMQRDVIRALTKVDKFMWSYANFLLLLRPRGLPGTLRELQALVEVV